MQQIIYFFSRNKNFFFFISLLFIGLGLTIRSNYYHQSRFFNSANAISGNLYKFISNSTQYFSLNEQNELLAEENRKLREELLKGKTSSARDSYVVFPKEKYTVKVARVVKNSIGLYKNYLTIDVGKKQGVHQDMAVISSKGIVGIVDNSSSNYSVVQSVLNTLSLLNAKLKKSGHFGTLRWDGTKINTVLLVDIPIIAPVAVGDTIVTGGMSSIFPEGIPIGVVDNFSVNHYDNSYKIEVTLFSDMTNLQYVYILDNQRKKEILEIEEETNNE